MAKDVALVTWAVILKGQFDTRGVEICKLMDVETRARRVDLARKRVIFKVSKWALF
jgi:hypothetical protein